MTTKNPKVFNSFKEFAAYYRPKKLAEHPITMQATKEEHDFILKLRGIPQRSKDNEHIS